MRRSLTLAMRQLSHLDAAVSRLQVSVKPLGRFKQFCASLTPISKCVQELEVNV